MSYVKKMIGTNFIEYASYVIKDRAITDINDGLKPVQRRILHSLQEMDDGKFNKVANVVGNTMKYHPHGDASIYSALVVLANKDMFIEKQGNFGNIYTGDEASAARYIECRLSPLAKEVLFNKDLTEYLDSYDGRNKEPITFPCKIPSLLLMGTEGIAVGMSTKVLPHNFREVLEAQIKILNKEKFEIYPDFQQGGMIDVSEYRKGNGKVKVRAVIEIRDNKTLIIKEIPFGTTTQSLINSIEAGVKKNRIKINSINDYTAENVEIELKTSRGEDAEDVLKALYAYSDCETSISVNLITILENKPAQLTVNKVLEYNTKRLVENLKRELEIEREKLTQKLHDLTLEQIFIENRIYKKIEELKTYESIIKTIIDAMNKFKHLFIRELTPEDVERLLQIRIKRISRFDIENYKKEIDDIVRYLKDIESNLKNLKKYTINYLSHLIEKYGNLYPRKTKIMKIDTITAKDIPAEEIKVFWDKNTGFLGTDVKGDHYFLATQFEKFLVISDDATYKVISIDSKKFIDTNILYLDKYNPEKIFSLIYTDVESNVSYAKKFQIEKFITNKIYALGSAANCKIDYFSTEANGSVVVRYKKKPRQKVNEERFDFSKLELKGVTARGNRVSTKELLKVVKTK